MFCSCECLIRCSSAVVALPVPHHSAPGWCHFNPRTSHYQELVQLSSNSRLHTWMRPAVATRSNGIVHQRTPQGVAATGQGKQRKRRTHKQNEVQKATFSIHSSKLSSGSGRSCSGSSSSSAPPPSDRILLYIPIKYEAVARLYCRKAGYTLTDVQDMQPTTSLAQAAILESTATLKRANTATAITVAGDQRTIQQHHTQPVASATTVELQQQRSKAETVQQALQQTGQHHDVAPSLPQQDLHAEYASSSAHHKLQPSTVSNSSPPAAEALEDHEQPVAAWQRAVDSRVKNTAKSSSRTISLARYNRLRGISSTSTSSNKTASAALGAVKQQLLLSQGLQERSSSNSSVADLQRQYVSSQQLSPQAEAELCFMYQRYLSLGQAMQAELEKRVKQQSVDHDDHPAHPLLQVQADSGPQMFNASISDIETQGVMAQGLLLELYKGLINKRVSAAAKIAPSADRRELEAAARRGLLQAAAKYDPTRAAVGSTTKFALLADMYMRVAIRDVLREYEASVLSLPVAVMELKMKLLKVQRQYIQQYGRKPSMEELAAAAGVTVQRAGKALYASAFQASGLDDVGGADEGDEAAGPDFSDLQLLDATDAVDDLEHLQGAVVASRSGLQQERDEAARAELLAAVMQQYLLTLSERDRSVLAMRIGIELPAPASAAPAEVEAVQHQSSGSRSSTTGAAQLAGAVITNQAMSLDEVAKQFNLRSRQRAHQLVDSAVKQLRERLQEAAERDAAVADVLGAAASS